MQTQQRDEWIESRRRGWSDWAARASAGWLLFCTLTGLSLWFAPFSRFNQLGLALHTLLGLALLPVVAVYSWRHAARYWSAPLSQVKFTGWAAATALTVCIASGLVLTVQAALDSQIDYAWRLTHQLSTVATLAFVAPHVIAPLKRERRSGHAGRTSLWSPARNWARAASLIALAGVAAGAAFSLALRPTDYEMEFPADYERRAYEGLGPFAPSLANTAHGGALAPTALSGSASCGTSGCHEQIYEEWLPSAHRYAAMDEVFQGIQGLMANQNGPVSTRYCAGCHDPISLFSGEKSFATASLTGKAGLDEGVSCVACHAIQATDVKGNASYVVKPPERYLWEGESGWRKTVSDFLIRAYPDHHVASLSRRMFKTSEFCAACHKQFIDESVNNVGWVQLQNQYDNWKSSRWNHASDPQQRLECRECHMPLHDSTDPASGDGADFNRTASDGKHRSHRFLGGNQFIPAKMNLEGGQEHAQLTHAWLRGEVEISEIAARWRSGPAAPIEILAPEEVRVGENVKLRVQVLNNKVGHDFPTGPLDIIQAWIEISVSDATGRVLLASGQLDEQRFIETGTFMFKAEPVDRHGNLIDRHNLWEMVGVRFKRALFPGQTEQARYEFMCSGLSGDAPAAQEASADAPNESVELAVPSGVSGPLTVQARLRYRKVDQYLTHFVYGEASGVSSPITDVAEARATIQVAAAEPATPNAANGGARR